MGNGDRPCYCESIAGAFLFLVLNLSTHRASKEINILKD